MPNLTERHTKMPTEQNGSSITTHKGTSRVKRLVAFVGEVFLGLVTLMSAIVIFLIFFAIVREALPFLHMSASDLADWEYDVPDQAPIRQFFTSTAYYPAEDPPKFGALALFYGTGVVTLGAMMVALPLGVAAAVCMSDVVPFGVRQKVKPVIEILAAIPSVAYGFFALVLFAPLLQEHGSIFLSAAAVILGLPLLVIAGIVLGDLLGGWAAEDREGTIYRISAGLVGLEAALLSFIALRSAYIRFGAGGALWAGAALAGACALVAVLRNEDTRRTFLRRGSQVLFVALGCLLIYLLAARLADVRIVTGVNVLNVSIILGAMALPTVVSVSEDALFAAGRELREASYGLGATRAETLLKIIIPAARSGILAAGILGVMRAVGETMVVLMASGNAAQVPGVNSTQIPVIDQWTDVPAAMLLSARTLTATIAQEMNEIQHTHGAPRFSALFTMSLCLLTFSLIANLASEWAVRRSVRRLEGR
jgi:phosphate transport system permease protein